MTQKIGSAVSRNYIRNPYRFVPHPYRAQSTGRDCGSHGSVPELSSTVISTFRLQRIYHSSADLI